MATKENARSSTEAPARFLREPECRALTDLSRSTPEICREGILRVTVKWPCDHRVTDKFSTPQAAAQGFELAIADPPTQHARLQRQEGP